jgi:hypothetical protein
MFQTRRLLTVYCLPLIWMKQRMMSTHAIANKDAAAEKGTHKIPAAIRYTDRVGRCL